MVAIDRFPRDFSMNPGYLLVSEDLLQIVKVQFIENKLYKTVVFCSESDYGRFSDTSTRAVRTLLQITTLL